MHDKADIKAVTKEAIYPGEMPSPMEPSLVFETSWHRGEPIDLALELASRSTGIRGSLPQGVLGALPSLVHSMNCHYGNLIEGRDTHAVDIVRALQNNYSADKEKCDL